MDVPIIFIVFNRPELTARVLARIREARPSKLFVVADGPRPHRIGEAEKCLQVRDMIERGIDWPCEVVRDYSEVNLGCGRRVSSGITNAFRHTEEAIIVEDDCLPDLTFFHFCAALLEKYREDARVGVISGDNFQGAGWSCAYSYYFSRYPHCWGWATWRRAWQGYDFEMKDWPALRDGGWLEKLPGSAMEAKFWRNNFDAVRSGRIDTWDYQWTFTCWKNDACAILPATNLVENIGFGREGTHTLHGAKPGNGVANAMQFPLAHPAAIQCNPDADLFTYRRHYQAPSFKQRLAAMLLRLVDLS